MREIAKQELIGFFIQQQQASVGPSAENLISGGSGQVPPNLMLAQIGPITTPSSVGSIANAKHLVDDIAEDTPCKLVIPYGRKLDKFREVGTTMALTGRVFPNPPPQSTHGLKLFRFLMSCERLISLLRMGSSLSVMRGTNTYCGIVEISYLMHHQVPACNLAKNEYPPRIQMLQWSSTQWVGNMEAITMTTT
jgi:hypothetical protein